MENECRQKIPCAVHVTVSKVVGVLVELMERISSLECRLEIAEEAVKASPISAEATQEVQTLDEMERRIVEAALALHRGSSPALAEELGLSERAIRYRKRGLRNVAGALR